jgi:hypothetical protein
MRSVDQLLANWSDLHERLLAAEEIVRSLARQRDRALHSLGEAVQRQRRGLAIETRPPSQSTRHLPAPLTGHSKDLPEDLQLLDCSELGKLIGRSTKTIREDSRRRPETLPPRFVVPGSNRLMWRVVDVRAWMQVLAEQERERQDQEASKKHGAIDFSYKSRPPASDRRKGK